MFETEGSQGEPTVRRRRYLSSVALAAGLAGCLGGGSGATTTSTEATTSTTGATTTGATTSTPDTTTTGATTSTPDTTTTTTARADCSSPTDLSKSDLDGGATLSAGCYRVKIRYEDSFEITDGTLRLEPGVTIQFANNDGLDFHDGGRLVAEGSPTAPVRLTGVEDGKGAWRGLRFRNSGSNRNRLEHTIVENAGGRLWHGGQQSKAGVFVQGGGRLTVRNSTIRENNNVGLTAGGSDARIDVADTVFEGNDLPVWLNANHVGDLAPSNAFGDNDQSYVRVGISGARTGVTREATWDPLGVPYRVTRHLWARSPLELRPGTTLLFEKASGMRIQGTGFTADAAGGDPIVLTGVEQERGFWNGLSLDGTSAGDVLLSNVVVEYGGRNRWHGGPHSQANLFLFGDFVDADPNGPALGPAGVEIHDSVVRGSGKHGISKMKAARIVGCDGMTYEDNVGRDTYDDGRNGPIPGC